jgi:preprotein translocase subunit SecE
MATKDKTDDETTSPAEPDEDLVDASFDDAAPAEPRDDEEAVEQAEPGEPDESTTPASLGATKYVHAAFFVAGIIGAYLSGKLLGTLWNNLAEWPTAVRAVPHLLRYAEDERETIAMAAGALVGVIAVIQTYRKEHIRRWADEVALELSKVTWPAKDTVTNGTVVVVIASMIATVYIALLDRFWGFLTTLVYGV